MTSARFYLPSVSSVPMSPYSTYYGGYVSQEMSSPLIGKEISRVWPGLVSPCYHPSFQSVLYQSTDEEKPTQSYIGLIGKAILSSPQQKLVLGDIYNYILANYPYFRSKGPGWRNSIRHNLSLNDCFVKLGRSPNGKGHFWAINPLNYEDFSRGEYKRKRASRRSRGSPASVKGLLTTTPEKWDKTIVSEDISQRALREMHCSNMFLSTRHILGSRGFHIENIL